MSAFSGHTPGPWRLCAEGDDDGGDLDHPLVWASDAASSNGHPLAQVRGGDGRRRAECEANARLIAAAPDLLAEIAQGHALLTSAGVPIDDHSNVEPHDIPLAERIEICLSNHKGALELEEEAGAGWRRAAHEFEVRFKGADVLLGETIDKLDSVARQRDDLLAALSALMEMLGPWEARTPNPQMRDALAAARAAIAKVSTA